MSQPTDTMGLTEVVQIAVGDGMTCALLQNGSVRCMGETARFAEPAPVEEAHQVLQLALRGTSACARRQDGTVLCWGPSMTNASGSDRWHATRTVPGISDVDLVVVSDGRGCALSRGGSVRCWGSCRVGECGDGTTGNHRNDAVTVQF